MTTQRDPVIRKPRVIRTWSGRHVDPLDLSVTDIDMADIAHALARQCRFNGHVDGFLSVARHSCWVSERLEYIGHRDLALVGLLHDAAEAYLSDVPTPLKHDPEMWSYRQIEERAEKVIATAFGIPHPLPQSVKDADVWVLENVEAPQARFACRGDYDADEDEFLARYWRLTGHTV